MQIIKDRREFYTGNLWNFKGSWTFENYKIQSSKIQGLYYNENMLESLESKDYVQ